jgi:hypothetical protein
VPGHRTILVTLLIFRLPFDPCLCYTILGETNSDVRTHETSYSGTSVDTKAFSMTPDSVSKKTCLCYDDVVLLDFVSHYCKTDLRPLLDII